MKKQLIIIVLTLFAIAPVNAQFFDKALKKVKDKAKGKIEALGAGSSARQNTPAVSVPADQQVKTPQNVETSNGPTGIVAYAQYDFLPGDKTIYFENFDKAALGELPQGWNSSGKGE
ncbi:MAG: hypothetical protein WC622_15125, partial [Pedobacter sp.]|uniref:hypothetical protein n=1 Tax=Pedobacter sp. TaxID=1411316 RepID=UPI003568A650